MSRSRGLTLPGPDWAAAGLVPVAEPRSTFSRYRRREGVLVNLAAGGVCGAAVIGAACSALYLGPLWGLGFLGLGFSAVGWMAEVFGLFGNDRLESLMRRRLGLPGGEWSFVGLCRAENNTLGAKLFPPRVETDENVGFLSIDDEGLTLVCEGARRELPRSAVRDVRLETVAEAPMLKWIRIEVYDQEEQLKALLLMVRAGQTLSGQRRANHALFERLRDWHVEHRLAPLVEAGELPEALRSPP